jgi:hypothetical protein
MNKKFVFQVGDNKKLYYDARPTKYQVLSRADNFRIFITSYELWFSKRAVNLCIRIGKEKKIRWYIQKNMCV